MNAQSITDMWNTVKAEITGAVNCVKGWYTSYKNSDYKQIRRKCTTEITLCTKNAPDTPIHTMTSNGDVKISLVDLWLLMAACAVFCGIAKLIRCRM